MFIIDGFHKSELLQLFCKHHKTKNSHSMFIDFQSKIDCMSSEDVQSILDWKSIPKSAITRHDYK